MSLNKYLVRMTAVCFVAMALWMPIGVLASQLDDALDAGEESANFFEGALTGLYQNALQAGEDTGNYEIDLIGSFVLNEGFSDRVGDTDLVFWAFSVNNLGNFQSTGQMQQKAGLLWATNDIDVDSSVTQFGVLGVRQFFYSDRLELGVGKMFPGMIHTESNYTANNSETFMSKIVAASAVGSYFEAIGLGANLEYEAENWFVQGGFSDAKAESEIDFESLFDGVWSWTAEAGWAPRDLDGSSSVSVLAFRTDRTATLTRQNGWAIAATHDFGDTGQYGIFGRYTWADGGEGITPENRANELPLKSGGFVGFAWNRPFGRENDQLGIAAVFGEPTRHQRELGYNTQYGIESFWRFNLGSYVRLGPSIQLLHNRESDLEVVLGFRLKASKDFARYFSTHP
jgi:carbohydrate-selective porin OprB